MSAIALCVNPMSGRDVRRLAARATNMTHEAKRDIVARIAAGADAVGVQDIYIVREPFQIASGALDMMSLNARVHVLDVKLRNDASDTERAVRAFVEAGVGTFVSLGGDGTNRAITRTAPHIDLIPLSTGTNNVFPVLTEPTIAGMVAGLNARGMLDNDLRRTSKIIQVRSGAHRDVGMIDAVLLRNDHVGNLLPFDTARIQSILLTRAEPDAIGMSPIGGLIDPVYAEDDAGLLLTLGEGGRRFLAPVSPGLFRPVAVTACRRVALGETLHFNGAGVLALDGDRDIKVAAGETVALTIERAGPRVIDIARAMRRAVEAGIIDTALLPQDQTPRE